MRVQPGEEAPNSMGLELSFSSSLCASQVLVHGSMFFIYGRHVQLEAYFKTLRVKCGGRCLAPKSADRVSVMA